VVADHAIVATGDCRPFHYNAVIFTFLLKFFIIWETQENLAIERIVASGVSVNAVQWNGNYINVFME
jgi:hypothetical protein